MAIYRAAPSHSCSPTSRAARGCGSSTRRRCRRARAPRRDPAPGDRSDGGVVYQDHRRCLPGRLRHRAGGLAAALAAQRALPAKLGRGRRDAGAHGAAHRRGRAAAMATTSHRRAQPPRALARRGHGGQILLSRSTAELVRDTLPPDVTLRDLGEHRLKDLAPRADLPARRADLPADFPPLRTLDRPPHNLPAQPTAADRARAARWRRSARCCAAPMCACHADRPGRHRQDPPGAPGRRRAARRLRAMASGSSTWRRSATRPWSSPTIAQTLACRSAAASRCSSA